MLERLQKVLAKAGVASRRRAEELIRQGKVRVDGRIITEMGTKVDPETQNIECEGVALVSREEKVYILLHKPTGYLSTVDDPKGRPIVTDLLKNIKERVYPVGRLDLNTEGALLLTNDGELSQKILHPSHEVNKTYVAKVKGVPGRKKLDALSKGIELEGRKTWPASIKVLKTEAQSTVIQIIIHEGRKRQVRKMFEAIGHPVLALKRTAYGQLELGGLGPGKYRFLTPRDIKFIFDK
ncbi:MAG: pseudouridine synthase [Desulfobacterales bacterium]|jgi:23S rRNA pseudouridine2605 synthase|nr:pseudouridine synthase [Desulfobacterales bacterium]